MRKRTDVERALRRAAKIHAARTAVYGESYKNTGAALLALFGGKIPAISDARAAARLYLSIMCLIKLRRAAKTTSRKARKDSAKDLIVYGAMLSEFCDE